MTRPKDVGPLVLRAESVRLSGAAIEAMAEELPADQEQVSRLLEESVDGYFGRAFTAASLAALHKGIPVDARHLVEGTRLLPDPGYIARLSAHVAGDVVGALVGAVADGRLSREREAVALFLAAYWSREREGASHRQELVRHTRMGARLAYGPAGAYLAAASEILGDDELSRLMARVPAGSFMPIASEWTAPILEIASGPILAGLRDDEAEPTTTRRRAVDRVGRNEPCPCGSGKKYKRCCEAKDQERLRDSSDVAGVTRAEIRLHPEEHLARERIDSMRAHELAGLDPTRIAPELHGVVLNRLILFQEFDALRDFFAAVGVDRNQGHVWDAAAAALRADKRDAAKTFVELAPLPDEDWLGFSLRLLTNGIESCPGLDALEAEARNKTDAEAVDLACDMMRSAWPGIGILLARGVAPLAPPWERETLFQEIGLTRDRLDLPAVEPTAEMEDLWGMEETWDLQEGRPPVEPLRGDPAAPEADDVAQRLLDQNLLERKEAELARLRGKLSELHRNLEEQARATTEPDTGAPPVTERPPADDPRVVKLRERVEHLRSDLSQRHAERNQLRRQLERTQKRVDLLEAERGSAEQGRRTEAGDEPEGEPVEAGIVLTFRVPVFSRRFRASSESLPDHVRRRAVIVASRIAAGDENAFRGTRRLRRDRDLYRQRVGRDHRLIFRMGAHELEAVDLVPRKDLERAIRELAGH